MIRASPRNPRSSPVAESGTTDQAADRSLETHVGGRALLGSVCHEQLGGALTLDIAVEGLGQARAGQPRSFPLVVRLLFPTLDLERAHRVGAHIRRLLLIAPLRDASLRGPPLVPNQKKGPRWILLGGNLNIARWSRLAGVTGVGGGTMEQEASSPRVTHLSWGRLEVEGEEGPFKDD